MMANNEAEHITTSKPYDERAEGVAMKLFAEIDRCEGLMVSAYICAYSGEELWKDEPPRVSSGPLRLE